MLNVFYWHLTTIKCAYYITIEVKYYYFTYYTWHQSYGAIIVLLFLDFIHNTNMKRYT